MTEGEDAEFTVTLSPKSSNTVTVDYTTSDGTATAGTDYTAGTATTLTFNPHDTEETISVRTMDDSVDELEETFTVTLGDAKNAKISTIKGTGTGTIIDDDYPSLSINNVRVTEGEDAEFTVTLRLRSSNTVTVKYQISDGTATAGTDYTTGTATTLTFNPDDTEKTILVLTTNDSVDEELMETFTVTLSDAKNANISTTEGTGTITDDDGPASLSINNVRVTEGGDAKFTVTLSPKSSNTVTVKYQISDGTATAGTDYTAGTATTLTFNPGDTKKTISVPTTSDWIKWEKEKEETFTVMLSDGENANISTTEGTGTITDDDDTLVVTTLLLFIFKGLLVGVLVGLIISYLPSFGSFVKRGIYVVRQAICKHSLKP